MDLLYLVITVLFFVASWGLMRLCATLKGDQ